MLIQRTLSNTILASFALSSLSAFAADPVVDKSTPPKGPESGTTSPMEKKQENKDTANTDAAQKAASPTDSSGGLLLPFGKIGPSAAVNIPGIVNVGLDARLFKIFGVGFDFGPSMSTGKQKTGEMEAELKFSHWDVRAAWFPWGGSLFIGGAFGAQKLAFEASTKATVTVNGTSRKVPVKVTGDISTTFLTPHLGWQWLWDSGFMMGTEFGAQLALNSKSSLNADVNDPTLTAAEKALVLQQPEYLKAKKEAEDAGKKVGEVTLPYWNILKIGWLF